ncbi:methyl-accepting chemotaxis protein [Rhizobium sp. NZLR1]|uniref:methyl-accepting chemotaxis protein n=1 Tax=Rhizobium sp. NZLR1 TaxID=2731096 RepID=UPI001A9A0982|nr:methyl-accepting chemotaxis protein [Rhizobium sp. NZLR1]MBX5204037.1 methyl-accepting chemotaxis protein [Rhizobium sp. NZLR1]QSZ25164.1 methyl-accepting chemotaxis protein [Rhizobium sp. NZLR1]
MARLSLRNLLYLIAAAPLLAFLWLSTLSVLNSYAEYQYLSRQIVVQRLANAGAAIAQALPAEAFATAENRSERRNAVDSAFSNLQYAYDQWKSRGYSDEPIARAFGAAMEKFAALPGYRQHVDAGTVGMNESTFILQPGSAAGLELVRRSAATIGDLRLAHLIEGYHALMQVNDAGLIEIKFGEKYLSGSKLTTEEYAFLLHAKELRNHFTAQMLEFLPDETVSEYNRFSSTDDGRFLTETLATIYRNEPTAGQSQWIQKWSDAKRIQAGVMSKLIAATDMELMAAAEGRLRKLKEEFIFSGVSTALITFLVLGLCYLVLRSVSGTILTIQQRMRSLAEGETNTAIPFIDRRDQIGEIARSIEIFRLGAIRSEELENAAEINRQRAERERLEIQRSSEIQAEERLRKATSALAEGLQKLASGDMSSEIEEPFALQFEPLRHDFNVSVVQLRSVLLSVGQAGSAVSAGSYEISKASDNLAKRTEQQAASLEETAAALEQITSNVRSTSARSGEARDLVRDARNKAERSSTVVGNAVLAMNKIEQSSNQIDQIIGVIDEIAFQTNLLALNAGVEAARAGEAGKGFAVVAQEVRELAQRSATAAKEIKNLVKNSANAVGDGVKLVKDTGDGLTAIAALVQLINSHMDAIAYAAQEQSVGLSEVNTAVNHMDQATQQNAAMVQEMNAASAGLAQEAAHLSELLDQFQLANHSGGQRNQHQLVQGLAA